MHMCACVCGWMIAAASQSVSQSVALRAVPRDSRVRRGRVPPVRIDRRVDRDRWIIRPRETFRVDKVRYTPV